VATHQELFHHIAEAYIEVDMIQDAIHVYEQIRDAIEVSNKVTYTIGNIHGMFV
jgi:hypothetical protein